MREALSARSAARRVVIALVSFSLPRLQRLLAASNTRLRTCWFCSELRMPCEVGSSSVMRYLPSLPADFAASAAALMPLSMAVGFVESRAVSLALICVVTFAHMGWKTNQATLTNDIYPREVVGVVSGLLAFGNGLGGTIFTALTGWMVVQFNYASVFVLMGLLHPVSYLLVRWLVRTPLQTTPSLHP